MVYVKCWKNVKSMEKCFFDLFALKNALIDLLRVKNIFFVNIGPRWTKIDSNMNALTNSEKKSFFKLFTVI